MLLLSLKYLIWHKITEGRACTVTVMLENTITLNSELKSFFFFLSFKLLTDVLNVCMRNLEQI